MEFYSKHFTSKRLKIAGFFIIIMITQGAKVPRGTLATTMFGNGIKLARTS